MLAALGLIEPDGRLLRAGELLLSAPDRPGHPQVVYQYRATPAGEPRAVERLEAPLLLAYERIMDLVSARRNLTPLNLPGGQQLQLEDFPELAVREALTNAIIHRDHRLADPVVIEHSPTLFSITSPGPLVSGVTLENILTHRSKPRNPALARAARLLGIAEEVGRGVDRMYREMIRSGRDVPRIEGDFDEVRVSLAGTAPDTHVARYVATLPDSERDDTDAMLVLLYLLRRRTVTAQDVAPVLQRDPDQAETVLRRLESPGVRMLEPTRQTAGRRRPTYRLTEEVLKDLGTRGGPSTPGGTSRSPPSPPGSRHSLRNWLVVGSAQVFHGAARQGSRAGRSPRPRPASRAWTMAWLRCVACSFPRIVVTLLATVFADKCRRVPISALLRPAAR